MKMLCSVIEALIKKNGVGYVIYKIEDYARNYTWSEKGIIRAIIEPGGRTAARDGDRDRY
jgi:hypothetical protein